MRQKGLFHFLTGRCADFSAQRKIFDYRTAPLFVCPIVVPALNLRLGYAPIGIFSPKEVVSYES